jgi:hypothetical protein
MCTILLPPCDKPISIKIIYHIIIFSAHPVYKLLVCAKSPIKSVHPGKTKPFRHHCYKNAADAETNPP